ncbi:mucoidy inhibitor MuiA family protein [Plantactinospora sp. KLBMP9567]|uniref:mucoidy inhibitor MuiA family protein n=1 Tax=Plantactinospora sp. KLBMP9567 TaxID=3085900 RepID=UPI0029829435|nr:mucoidy inhibitor MuiA family protein [Plantactinospora sp. KLBMP9567]MDW5322844.1 mucoidy inhibitor MuiA family protein [Plantactinospora sp. KLBMP9567]
MTPSRIDAPIVAVTVYPDRARVTRRTDLRLPPGEHRVRIGPLPLGLLRDSLRVGGRGPATVLGVDVSTEVLPRATEGTAAGLTERRRGITAELAELADAEAVEGQRADFLALLTQRAGASYARALAAGEATPGDVAGFTDSVAEQTAASQARRRELARRQEEARERLAAVEREIAALSGRRSPDRLAAEVTLRIEPDGQAEPTAPEPSAEVQLELSYVVQGAGWTSSYDLRLVDETLTLTWFGLVSQRTGEDWPECALLLSTARPATGTELPELEPWYLRQAEPTVWMEQEGGWGGGPVRARAAGGPLSPAAMPVPGAAGTAQSSGAAPRPPAPVAQPTATLTQGAQAATYEPARPVAVPADGGAHRAVVAVLELAARLDHVTAPVRTPGVHLRATAVNGSEHTLLPGPASVFHGGDFVGGTTLPTWAPGEEVEVALGLDDRIRVKRELVRRSDTKATLGSTRRREVEYRITLANHTPRPARLTVRDQLPVSQSDGITVRELRLDPPPDERAALGELIWRVELPPGGSREIVTGLRVELAKGVELVGWRD